MKRLAYVLMAVGVLVAVIAFNLDVTVGDSGFANINMMAQRQNLLIVGCVGFLGGIVLLIGALQQGNLKAQTPVPEQDANVASFTSAKSMAIAFWRQRCWRRPNTDPPCRSKNDPGRGAAFLSSSCG